MGGVEIGSCFHVHTCRDTLLYEITYLCSPVACYLQSSYCCMQKPIHTQNIHASLRSFVAREEVVHECMSCGKLKGVYERNAESRICEIPDQIEAYLVKSL